MLLNDNCQVGYDLCDLRELCIIISVFSIPGSRIILSDTLGGLIVPPDRTYAIFDGLSFAVLG